MSCIWYLHELVFRHHHSGKLAKASSNPVYNYKYKKSKNKVRMQRPQMGKKYTCIVISKFISDSLFIYGSSELVNCTISYCIEHNTGLEIT